MGGLKAEQFQGLFLAEEAQFRVIAWGCPYFLQPGVFRNTANYLHGWSTSAREDDKLKVHIALAAP